MKLKEAAGQLNAVVLPPASLPVVVIRIVSVHACVCAFVSTSPAPVLNNNATVRLCTAGSCRAAQALFLAKGKVIFKTRRTLFDNLVAAVGAPRRYTHKYTRAHAAVEHSDALRAHGVKFHSFWGCVKKLTSFEKAAVGVARCTQALALN
jgi:hypothetical protein